MYIEVLTIVHVAISLIGIVAGFAVIFGMFGNNPMEGVAKIFLWMTILTSVTGFFYPIHEVTPGIVIGVLSLIVLAFTWTARYTKHMAGGWRATYVITAILAQYFNFFVLIVQSFEKVPALHTLAPTGKEPPFAATQGFFLLLFIVFTIVALKKFHPAQRTA
jgi:hypothetical protein